MTHKLTYFDIPARAYPIRSAFKHGNIDFIDERITRDQLQEAKGSAGFSDAFPLGQVPVLTLPDGRVIAQTNAIARYVAKLSGLYPTDPIEALLVDELMDTYNDVGPSIPQSKVEEEKKVLREAWAAGKLRVIYTFFSNKIAAAGGVYATGNRLTVADFFLYSLFKLIRSGFIDYVPKDYDSQWPTLVEYMNGLENNPSFAPYLLD